MADRGQLLTAFSDPTRQAVLNLLRRGPATVGELGRSLPVSRPAVSQHLQVLKSVGLVEEERHGTRHYFRISPERLAELRTHVDSMWRDALAVFSRFAEKETSKNGASRKRTRPHSTKRPRRLSR